MNLKKLTNQNLDAHLKSLVANEREILKEILLHIIEVERRKLYLAFGYSSLFEYLTKNIGYANGSAQRRIDAARLSSEVPIVIDKLESGQINLAQVSLLQKSIREVQSNSKTKVGAKIKESLITQIASKSLAESEVLVAQTLQTQPKEFTKTHYQKDESVRLEITLSKVQWEKLIKMRELLSHSLPGGSGSNWDQVLEYVSEKVIRQKDKARVVVKSSQAVKQATKQPTQQPIQASRQLISTATQKIIHHRDRCCQYKDKTTGKQCGSNWKLTIDHIKPVWSGGGNETENLRVLCAAHNRQQYRQQATISRN